MDKIGRVKKILQSLINKHERSQLNFKKTGTSFKPYLDDYVKQIVDLDQPISQDLLLSDEKLVLQIDTEDCILCVQQIANAQVQHMIDLGYKSPEEVEEQVAQINQCHMSIDDLKRQLSEIDHKLSNVELAIEQARADERVKIGEWLEDKPTHPHLPTAPVRHVYQSEIDNLKGKG